MHRPYGPALLAVAALLAISEIHGQQIDSGATRVTALTKQRQDTLQELSQVAKERKELQASDLDAEGEQQRLGPQWSFQKQELIQRRNGIAESLKSNARREAALNGKLKGLDDQLRGLEGGSGSSSTTN
jgi:uncharacterized protein (DUF3084 family)